MYDYNRLIENAMAARLRAKSSWGRKYWGGVVDQLVKNMRKQDTVH